MSQLEPDLSLSCSHTDPPDLLLTPRHAVSGPGPSFSPANPSGRFRMVSTLGKRRAATSSNDLEADFKEQTSIKRKLEEETLSGEKSKPVPILVGQASRTSVQ